MTQEEAEELKQELQDLRQQVAAHQQQQDQQDHQQQLHAAEAQAWRAERSQLQQAVEDAQAAAAKAQQHADKQLQQLQANADSQEGLVRHLSWQLEAAQQALQQQQHDDDEQQQQQSSQLDVGSAAVPGCVLAEVATDKACSAARILQFLADEVQELSRQEAVHQCLTDQLLGEASSAAGALVGWLRCCMTLLEHDAPSAHCDSLSCCAGSLADACPLCRLLPVLYQPHIPKSTTRWFHQYCCLARCCSCRSLMAQCRARCWRCW